MTATCHCGRPLRDTQAICDGCTDAIGRALGQVAWLADELETTITKRRAIANESGPRSSSEGLPWHEKAADAGRHLRVILVGWVRLCHDERVRHQSPTSGLPVDTLTGMARWLMWRLDGIQQHAAAVDAHHEITDAVRDCLRVIDRPPPREFVGSCDCGRDLYRRGGGDARCRGCGLEWSADVLLDWMRGQVMARNVTVREGAGLLGRFGFVVPLRTVEDWAERGRLPRAGSTPEGAAVYPFALMVDLATARAERVAARGDAG